MKLDISKLQTVMHNSNLTHSITKHMLENERSHHA